MCSFSAPTRSVAARPRISYASGSGGRLRRSRFLGIRRCGNKPGFCRRLDQRSASRMRFDRRLSVHSATRKSGTDQNPEIHLFSSSRESASLGSRAFRPLEHPRAGRPRSRENRADVSGRMTNPEKASVSVQSPEMALGQTTVPDRASSGRTRQRLCSDDRITR